MIWKQRMQCCLQAVISMSVHVPSNNRENSQSIFDYLLNGSTSKDTFTIQTCGENGIGQAIVGGAVRLYRQT